MFILVRYGHIPIFRAYRPISRIYTLNSSLGQVIRPRLANLAQILCPKVGPKVVFCGVDANGICLYWLDMAIFQFLELP